MKQRYSSSLNMLSKNIRFDLKPPKTELCSSIIFMFLLASLQTLTHLLRKPLLESVTSPETLFKLLPVLSAGGSPCMEIGR